MLTDQKGVSAFPNLTPTGGSINGIPVLVSDGVLTGNVILIDATGIAAASGDVTLNEFREGSVQLDTSPDSPPSAATNFISLWQNNLSAIVVERSFSQPNYAVTPSRFAATAIVTKAATARHRGKK